MSPTMELPRALCAARFREYGEASDHLHCSHNPNRDNQTQRTRFLSSHVNMFDTVVCLFSAVSTLAFLSGASRGLHEDVVDAFEVGDVVVVRCLLCSRLARCRSPSLTFSHGMCIQDEPRVLDSSYSVRFRSLCCLC